MNKVIIIGGGVSGITTALTLQLLGWETVCYADHLVDEQASDDPRFASLYPAASVIPHSVETDNIAALLPASLSIFEGLYEREDKSMALHRHFELYEFPVEYPPYTRYLHNFSSYENTDDHSIPRRSDAPELHGWVFDCLVAEFPEYIYQLYTWYNQAGGTIISQKISPEDIADLAADIIINCTGIWSSELFDDPAEQKIVRGHLVHIPNKKPITDSQNRIASYNYTPLPSIYATPDGKPTDVYFYPIGNTWILGGSRQHGTLDEHGRWQGGNYKDTASISDFDVPQPILNLNEDILKNSYQLETKLSSLPLKAKIGYRYSRGDGLRIEASQEYGKKIIHNYGHGGAGVTLSWGCALYVLHMINRATGRELSFTTTNKNTLLKPLQIELQKVYLKYIQSKS